jgi:hypothetical protein
VIGDDLALRRYWNWNSGDRETVPGHQGRAEVPDVETAHKVIRPETHWLVRRM